MLGIMEHIRGSVADVRKLLRDDGADENEGQRLAEFRLSETQLAMIDSAIDEMGIDEAQRLADQLVNDPEFRRSIVRAAADSLGKRKR